MSGQKTVVQLLVDQAVGAVKIGWTFVKVVAGALFEASARIGAEREKDLGAIRNAVGAFIAKYGVRPVI